jgi:dTDP-4-amino-4,6-dideoxygalactose transaminase
MKQIPMLDLRLEYEYMKAEVDARIGKCLEHQKWILGPEVEELERTVAGYLKVGNCIGVSSGTDALVIALRALAIKTKGQEYFDAADEVITTPFTFTATGDAILRAGAKAVFVDIEPGTFNIDTSQMRSYLAGENKVVGIIAVHLYGQSCNMDKIMKIAREHNLFVVEDVAQAFGGRWGEKKLGTIGDAGAFSFFPSKNLGGFGDGGMIATNDGQTAELARMLLKHGGRDKYNVEHIGYNSRLDTLQAAVLLAKFKYVDKFNENRRKIARVYTEGLCGISGLACPVEYPNTYHVYHQYTVRIAAGRRDEIKGKLAKRGADSVVYYPLPLHKMKVFAGRAAAGSNLEQAERASQEVLSLPIEPLLGEQEQLFVCRNIRELLS